MIRVIDFETFGSIHEGFLTVGQQHKEIPFEIKRVFWVVDTPQSVTRGGHAHVDTEMILIAVKGSIKINTIDTWGSIKSFELNHSNQGLYMPKMVWHEMTYSTDAVQLVLTSSDYSESDYIRSLSIFETKIEK